MMRRPRGSNIVYIRIAVSRSVHTRNHTQFIRRCHPRAIKSASQAILSRMQLTLHATHRTPLRASRLVQAFSDCLAGAKLKCSVPAPYEGVRGSIFARPCIIMIHISYRVHPPRSFVAGPQDWNRARRYYRGRCCCSCGRRRRRA